MITITEETNETFNYHLLILKIVSSKSVSWSGPGGGGGGGGVGPHVLR